MLSVYSNTIKKKERQQGQLATRRMLAFSIARSMYVRTTSPFLLSRVPLFCCLSWHTRRGLCGKRKETDGGNTKKKKRKGWTLHQSRRIWGRPQRSGPRFSLFFQRRRKGYARDRAKDTEAHPSHWQVALEGPEKKEREKKEDRDRAVDMDDDEASPLQTTPDTACNDRPSAPAVRIDDEIERARLIAGSLTSGTARQRLADIRRTNADQVLVSEYHALWSALASNRNASEAMGTRHTPTSVEVSAEYMARDAGAGAHMAALDGLATTDPEAAATQLVEALGASGRCKAVAPRASPIERDPRPTYFVLTSEKDGVVRAALFALPDADGDGIARIVLCIDYALRGTRIDGHVVKNRLWRDPRLGCSYPDFVYLLLRAFADRAVYADSTCSGALRPRICAASDWFTRPLARLSSPRDVPYAVRRYIDGPHESYRWHGTFQGEWMSGVLHGIRLGEARIENIVCLLAGRRCADRASSLFASPRSLLDRASAAYRGSLRAGVLPSDVLARAAARAWHRVCVETPLPSGRLPHGDTLLDIARGFDVEPTPAQLERPELLCARLAEPAVAEMVRSRYGLDPVRVPVAFGALYHCAQLWASLADCAPGTRPDPETSHCLAQCASRNGVTLDADDKVDAQRLYARMAVLVTGCRGPDQGPGRRIPHDAC